MVNNYKIKSEKNLSFVMCRILGRIGHVQRHEDKYDTGIPDLSYSLPNGQNGWIELKFRNKRPADLNTLINIRHLTEAQIEWLEDRGKFCNCCYVLFHVDSNFLLIPHYNLKKLNKTKWKDIGKLTTVSWKNSTLPSEVIEIFKKLE